jgi:hypothetical protein
MNDFVRWCRERPADFDPERLAGQPLERGGVSARRPQLQFCVARRPQLQQIIVSAVVQIEPGDGLRMAAVEAFGQPQDGGERADRVPRAAAHVSEPGMASLGRRLTVIARDERDRFDLVRLEAAQVAVLDQVIRVSVVLLVADVNAHVVQNRRVLEPLALAIGEPVNRARLVEQRGRQPCDLR